MFLFEPIIAAVFGELTYGDGTSSIIGWVILIAIILEFVAFDIKFKALTHRHKNQPVHADSLTIIWRWVLHAGLSIVMLIFAGIAFGFSFDDSLSPALVGMGAVFAVVIKELVMLLRYFSGKSASKPSNAPEWLADIVLFFYAAVSYTMYWTVLVAESSDPLLTNHAVLTGMNILLFTLLYWIGLSAVRLPYLMEEQFAPKKSRERLFVRASTIIAIIVAVSQLL